MGCARWWRHWKPTSPWMSLGACPLLSFLESKPSKRIRPVGQVAISHDSEIDLHREAAGEEDTSALRDLPRVPDHVTVSSHTNVAVTTAPRVGDPWCLPLVTEANLSRLSLSGANLTEAKLVEANLPEASLGGANLSGADFSRACLCTASLSRAKLCEASLSEANL
jgi:Pentapeptide repeats (8 copies)